MNDPFAFLYSTRKDRAVFGKNWCGPDVLDHYKASVCARYKGYGDGMDVEVVIEAAPARFYKIIAKSGVNSVGHPTNGFTLSTGTIDAELVVGMAEAIAEGCLVLK